MELVCFSINFIIIYPWRFYVTVSRFIFLIKVRSVAVSG